MTIDEVITHCEEVAEKQEITAKSNLIEIDKIKADGILRLYDADEYESCMKCAKEHRQLAEWLKELKRWREFCRNNAQFINDCLIQNRIDELYSSEIKNDADILRIDNEVLTLRTINEFCKSFNERYERWEREQNDE